MYLNNLIDELNGSNNKMCKEAAAALKLVLGWVDSDKRWMQILREENDKMYAEVDRLQDEEKRLNTEISRLITTCNNLCADNARFEEQVIALKAGAKQEIDCVPIVILPDGTTWNMAKGLTFKVISREDFASLCDDRVDAQDTKAIIEMEVN